MKEEDESTRIRAHPSCVISDSAIIGDGTKIWCFSQIMDDAAIGKNCVIGQCVYIDRNVKIGNNVKIHNKASIYHGVVVEDDVFIGPHACLANDKRPRHDKTRNLSGVEWRVKRGASIGAGSVVLPDVDIGEYAMVGAGSVVTKDVPANAVVYGNPAKIKSFVCRCGEDLRKPKEGNNGFVFKCASCGNATSVDKKTYDSIQ